MKRTIVILLLVIIVPTGIRCYAQSEDYTSRGNNSQNLILTSKSSYVNMRAISEYVNMMNKQNNPIDPVAVSKSNKIAGMMSSKYFKEEPLLRLQDNSEFCPPLFGDDAGGFFDTLYNSLTKLQAKENTMMVSDPAIFSVLVDKDGNVIDVNCSHQVDKQLDSYVVNYFRDRRALNGGRLDGKSCFSQGILTYSYNLNRFTLSWIPILL